MPVVEVFERVQGGDLLQVGGQLDQLAVAVPGGVRVLEGPDNLKGQVSLGHDVIRLKTWLAR